MRGTTSIAMGLLAACGPSGKSDGGGAAEPTTSALCIDPLQPGGTSLQLVRETQPGLVADGDDKGLGAAETGRVAYAAVVEGEPGGPVVGVTAGEGCGARPCSPQVVRLADGKIAARAALPHADEIASGADYPFAVDWLSIEDGDGDGTPEVWLSYQIVSPPEPAVGSTTRSYVAVFSLPDLAPRFAASVDQRCEGELDLVDADCDGDRDLVLGQRCGSGDEAPQPTAEVFVRQPDGTYTKE